MIYIFATVFISRCLFRKRSKRCKESRKRLHCKGKRPPWHEPYFFFVNMFKNSARILCYKSVESVYRALVSAGYIWVSDPSNIQDCGLYIVIVLGPDGKRRKRS